MPLHKGQHVRKHKRSNRKKSWSAGRKQNTGYVVKLIPRFKDSRYPIYYLKPYKNEVGWSAKRAKKEAEFAMNGRLSTGVSTKDAYSFKIIKPILHVSSGFGQNYVSKVLEMEGYKGIAGIKQPEGIIISFTPTYDIKDSRLRERVMSKKVGSVIRV